MIYPDGFSGIHRRRNDNYKDQKNEERKYDDRQQRSKKHF